MGFDLSKWWHDFIDHLFKHPAAAEVAHPAIAAVAQAAQVTPALGVTIPGTDRQIPAVTAAYLGVSAETSQILDDRVKNAPPAGDGWIPGSELGNGQDFRANTYTEGVVFPYTVHAPGPFEFKWSDCPGTPAGMADVTVSGPSGTFHGSSFLKLGSIPVPSAQKGEIYNVSFIASASGPGHAQINPLAPA